MINPDRSFTKDLRTLDRRLGVKFNGQNFVVTYDRGHGEPVNIYVVKGQEGGFRQPNHKDLEELQKSDLEKEGPKEKWQRISSYMADFREKQKKRRTENIRNMTRDDKIQLKQAFEKVANNSKANATFRRVVLKKKGQSFGGRT